MGDDDVICLSSDDEVAHDESPRKKVKINYAPLTAKIEKKDNKKDTILCYLKRKSSDGNEKSINVGGKRQKVDKTVVEEIIIASPIKNDVVTKPSTAIRDHSDEPSVEALRDKLENGTISINKVNLKKTIESSKSINQPTPNDFKANIAPIRNNIQKQLTRCNSKEANGRKAISLKLRTTPSTSENPDRLLNPVAKSKDGANRKSSSPPIGKPKSASLSLKSGDGGLSSSTKPENIVDMVENPKAAANESDKHLDQKINSQEKSMNSPMICALSISPDVVILPRSETPKFSDKNKVTALFSNSSNNASNLEGKSLPNTGNPSNVPAQSVKKSHLPCVTDNQVLNERREIILTKTTDTVKGIKVSKETSEPEIRRITPLRLSETMSKSNQSNPADTEKLSKSVENSTTDNSKSSDSNIPNGHERSLSSDQKKTKVKNDSPSEIIVPKSSSSSKTPDNEESSSLKRKSKSPEIVEKFDKKSNEAPEFEPKPGCSKSPDEIMDGKPRLVVFDKKPVSLGTEDTFSMFLSLCLQTDRSLDMEKVVAKLKRYYEQLNPAYAASQAFRDTLNEKRELIARKGKKVVYHYVQLLKEDMKAKKKIVKPRAKVRGDDEGAVEGEDANADAAGAEDEEEDTEEARRVRHKIKRIEKAMKECQKMIKKYEEAEIDFDDDNNSNYIKLDRFKERMVQLYTQMCKYTNEHPDAGRAYLRPKHLRVTQIPSVDQAINSFINSKLSANKHKLAKGKSFVDGLIFPDYVDILECVEKVNKEHNMKLGKRAMQNLAEKAFTQMGKHLQQARQNDYWDTFSLNLDNNVDPATLDSDLMEKLGRNKAVAEANEKKVFEEFVRRQEERNTDDKDDSASEIEDEEDAEDEEQEDEQQSNDKKSNRDDHSDEPMSISDDTDRESLQENDENSSEAIETISESPDETKHTSKNNNLEPSLDSTANKDSIPSTSISLTSSPKNSAEKEATMIEVILDDVETEDVENERLEDGKLQRPLRIRSFAKPPDFWQCSQEGKGEKKNEDNLTKPKTLEDTEAEISVVSVLPGREKVVKNLTKKRKIIVAEPLKNITQKIIARPMTKRKLPTVESVNDPSTSSNTTNGQNSRYVKIAPSVNRHPVKLPPSRVQSNVQTAQIIAVSRAPQNLAINPRQVTLGTATATTSTPLQLPRSQINPRTTRQQTNQVPTLRLSNEKSVPASIAPRPPNTPRFVTVVATPSLVRPVKLLPRAFSTLPPLFRPAQILPGANIRLITPQIPPRNPTNFSSSVAVTSTPIQRLTNTNQPQNKAKVPGNLSAAQSSRVSVLRVNNGTYTMRSSSENLRIPQQPQQNPSPQQQIVGNIASSTALPVLTPRINDHSRTVQQQKTNVARAPQPGDQNWQTSEGGPKRKNELL